MDAADIIHIKDLLPTSLGSDELREQVAADILRRSVFSARMESARYLALVRDVCAEFAAGAINRAQAMERLMADLARMGHSPMDGGGLANPASIKRLDLIVKTQRGMAASVARLATQTEGVLHQFPAWELARVSGRAVPRSDWPARWAAAGSSCGFEGALQDRFIALKDSPIWQALGDGAGGYRDTLLNPFPPFAYGSGMGWIGVDRDQCIELGLIGSDEEVGRPDGASLSPTERELADAAERFGITEEMLLEGLE